RLAGGADDAVRRKTVELTREQAAAAAQLHMQHMVPRGDDGAIVINSTTREFTVLAHRLTFAPFSASVRQPDGRWATVEPPRGLLSPWQLRVLLALGISMLLLAPLVWWLARRLTRPIRVFADAAERLGADPDAEPLAPSGPSEVRTAIHAFNDMQASLREHMRQRTQTIAAIAHDLRTPLTRLRFRAEQAPAAVRDRMATDIEEMDALIAQAMAFVRGESTAERREPLDLGPLAADCAAGFTETGADVRFEGGGALPVEGDPAALRRALANLIGNAVKYGGGARVKAFVEDGRAVVEVSDDGPGLAGDELEAVFDPFHRGERSRSRETGGTGLGLTVARQAARAHGGDVTLTNRTGGGLTARLALPLAPPGAEQA
ncbi:ATP-binding protein, partial [Brevundimonas sp.]|uniref:ATP-binding protein n=2 Tax=Brevundimonas sp. TaxID=1871086 RepID=UPI0027E84AB3